MTTTKISSFTLPAEHQFQGNNLETFFDVFNLLLNQQKSMYLVDSKVEKPKDANEAVDKVNLYGLLMMNISDTAKNLIAKHRPDGQAAYKALKSFYSESNSAILMELAWEHGHMSWSGGSQEEFDKWLSRFLELSNKLTQHECGYEDWRLAMLLVSKVPREFVINNLAFNAIKPKEMKLDAVIEQIRVRLMLTKAGDETAMFASTKNGQTRSGRQTENKPKGGNQTGDRPKYTCNICKDILLLPEKQYTNHSQDKCWNKERFSKLLSKMNTNTNNDSANIVTESDTTSIVNISIDETYEADCCMVTEDDVAFLTEEPTLRHSTWIVDSGCSRSMTNLDGMLDNFKEIKEGFVQIADGTRLPVKGHGTFTFRGDDNRIWRMSKVFYVPQLHSNLFSVKHFTKSGGKVVLDGEGGKLISAQGSLIASAANYRDLYRTVLTRAEGTSSQSQHVAFMADSDLLHRRYGHVSLHDGQDGLPDVRVECEPCMLGKFKRLPFNGSPPSVTTVFEHVSVDVFGATRVSTWGGKRYMLVITDSASKYTKVVLLEHKSEAYESVKAFVTNIERQTSHKIKNIHADGGELDSNKMKRYCQQLGIDFHPTAPYTSNQNAIVERRIGIIVADARTLLIDSGLSGRFWGYAAMHATYIRNRLTPKDGISPHEAVYGKKPSLKHLHPFGCAAFRWIPPVHRPEGKLGPRAEKTVYVGCEDGISNFRLFNLETEQGFRSRDVKFYEHHFPAKRGAKHDLAWFNIQWEMSQPATNNDRNVSWEIETEESLPSAVARRNPRQPIPRTPVQTRSRIEADQRAPSESDEDAAPMGTVIHPNAPEGEDTGSDTSDDPLAFAVR